MSGPEDGSSRTGPRDDTVPVSRALQVVVAWLFSHRRRIAQILFIYLGSEFIANMSGFRPFLPVVVRDTAGLFGGLVGGVAIAWAGGVRRRVQPPRAVLVAITASAACVVFASGFFVLRERCLIAWTPPADIVEDTVDHYGAENVSEHVHFVRVGRGPDPYKAIVFIPMMFSETTKATLDARAPGDEAILDVLDHNFEEFLGWLETRERTQVAITLVAFFIVYLGMIAWGAAAWGVSYDPTAEGITKLAGGE